MALLVAGVADTAENLAKNLFLVNNLFETHFRTKNTGKNNP